MQLTSPVGKKFLHQEYLERGLSIREIARITRETNSHVRKCLKMHGIQLRTRAEAQRLALQKGRAKHPTEGAKRKESTKQKIGRSAALRWSDISDDARLEIAQKARERWQAMPPEQRQAFIEKAHRNLQKTSVRGSKLEKHLLVELQVRGYEVTFHKKYLVSSESLHIDMVISSLKVAIEVDGPAHFRPIWGEERLQQSIARDKRKNGLILGAGYRLIRLRQESRDINRYRMDVGLQLVLDALSGPVELVFLSV